MNYSIDLLRKIRTTYVEELDALSLEQLNHIPSSHTNNIIWNAGHVLVVQQLLCYALSDLETYLEKSFIDRYRRGSAPTTVVDQAEVDFIKKMLLESVDLLEKDLASERFVKYKQYTVGFGAVLSNITDAVTFNNTHEGLHYGYLLALKKLV